MEKQEIYDKVCAHLAQQKTRSRGVMEDGRMDCAYRMPDGRRCAIGALIPDSMYVPEMDNPSDGESSTVGPLFHRYPEVAAYIGHPELCRALQAAHDFSEDVYHVRRELVGAAQAFDLTPGAEQAITEWS